MKSRRPNYVRQLEGYLSEGFPVSLTTRTAPSRN